MTSYDVISVNALDIANGLKDLLISHGFTIDLLLKTPPAELAIILGIDIYVARLIYLAAKKKLATPDAKQGTEGITNKISEYSNENATKLDVNDSQDKNELAFPTAKTESR